MFCKTVYIYIWLPETHAHGVYSMQVCGGYEHIWNCPLEQEVKNNKKGIAQNKEAKHRVNNGGIAKKKLVNTILE